MSVVQLRDRLPDNKFRREKDLRRLGIGVLSNFQQECKCLGGYVFKRLADSGQRWRGKCRRLDVIEADDRYVFRNTQSCLGQRPVSADCHLIAAHENSRWSPWIAENAL